MFRSSGRILVFRHLLPDVDIAVYGVLTVLVAVGIVAGELLPAERRTETKHNELVERCNAMAQQLDKTWSET